jgi:hypothetical protein
LIAWLLIGVWTFQNKTIATNTVWNLWFFAWTGDNHFDRTIEVDVGLLNESILSEFLLETLPQLCIQSVNNQLGSSWGTFLNVASIALSIIIALNGTYRYGYHMCWIHRRFDEVPVEVSLMGLFKLEISPEKQDSIDVSTRKIKTNKKISRTGDNLWRLSLYYNEELVLLDILRSMNINGHNQMALIAEDSNAAKVEDLRKYLHRDPRTLHRFEVFIEDVRTRKSMGGTESPRGGDASPVAYDEEATPIDYDDEADIDVSKSPESGPELEQSSTDLVVRPDGIELSVLDGEVI